MFNLAPLKHKDAKGTKELTKREKDIKTRRRDEHEDSRRFSYYRKYGYTFCPTQKTRPLILGKILPKARGLSSIY
jgi:hypothetical protein